MKLLLWLTAAHVAQVRDTGLTPRYYKVKRLTLTRIGRGKTWDNEKEAGRG